MCCKTTRKIDWVVNYSQFNTIVPISKSTKSREWSVIGGDKNSFFAPFYPIYSPSKHLGRCLLKIHNLPRPASNFNLRKMRFCVRFPFFIIIPIKIDDFLLTHFILDVFQGGGARPISPNASFTCKYH